MGNFTPASLRQAASQHVSLTDLFTVCVCERITGTSAIFSLQEGGGGMNSVVLFIDAI